MKTFILCLLLSVLTAISLIAQSVERERYVLESLGGCTVEAFYEYKKVLNPQRGTPDMPFYDVYARNVLVINGVRHEWKRADWFGGADDRLVLLKSETGFFIMFYDWNRSEQCDMYCVFVDKTGQIKWSKFINEHLGDNLGYSTHVNPDGTQDSYSRGVKPLTSTVSPENGWIYLEFRVNYHQFPQTLVGSLGHVVQIDVQTGREIKRTSF